jgi:hypothetical protein
MGREEPAATLDPSSAAGVPGSLADLFAEQYEPMVRLAHVLTGSNAVEDMPETEIASLLGCPVGTVKSDLHRGLAQLRMVVQL